MSKEIWIWSDTHFGHDNCYKFTNYDGTKMRPWDNAQEAEEFMIQEYNKLVKSTDTVYWLGDVCFKNSILNNIMVKFNNSRRILIMGNHDVKIYAHQWLKHFDDVRGCYNYDNYLMTHIPVSFESRQRFKRNIHGHTHGNFIRNASGSLNVWYKNCCVEVVGYKPINLSEIVEETNKLMQEGII